VIANPKAYWRAARTAQHQREVFRMRGPRTWWDLNRLSRPAPAMRLFFECGCGRRVPAVDPSIDPRRLVCGGCGARGPKLKQEPARRAA